jgi:hypothetical protein
MIQPGFQVYSSVYCTLTLLVRSAYTAGRVYPGGRIAIGLGRYALHVPSIKAALSGSHDAKFRPKLRLTEGGLLHVGLSIADLSCFRCVVVMVVARGGGGAVMTCQLCGEDEQLCFAATR